MSNSRSLLPHKSSALERATEAATDRLRAPAVNTLWDPWHCPLRLLPWLAWAVGVSQWDGEWSEAVQRKSVASAMEIAHRQGSVWAVKEALRAAGYADAAVEEGLPALRHDGTQLRDGLETYGSGNRWAVFRLIADIGEDKGVGGAELARLLRLIDAAKPVRSHLREVAYRSNVRDELGARDSHAITVQPALSEVRPAGRRHDGTLMRDNATQLPPEPLRRNLIWFRDGEIRRTGASPYVQWDVTGETRDNRWDAMTLGVRATIDEYPAIVAPGRCGQGRRDGALTRGAALPSMIDAGNLAITHRRRRNGRLSRNAAACRRAVQQRSTTL